MEDAAVKRTIEGTLFGLLAAVSYSFANTGLRYAADAGDLAWSLWAVFTKAVPAAILMWSVIAFRAAKGKPLFPPKKIVMRLLLAAAVMQFGGNLMFQYALSLGGLVLTVPLTFAFILTTGAVLGIVFLREALHLRTATAMLVLLVAIAALSLGGEGRTGLADLSMGAVLGTVIAAGISGISFGISSVVLRGSLRSDAPMTGVLAVFSTFGVVSMGLLSLTLMGPAEIAERSTGRLSIMFGAGCANAIAFFAVGAMFQRVSVNRGNLLNATQIAMCALAGVMLFDESFTVWVAIGTAMTIAALVLVGTHPSTTTPDRKPACEATAEIPINSAR